MLQTNLKLFQEGKRRCRICKVIKLLNEFWKDKSKPQGYGALCKECDKKRQRNEWKRFGSQPVRMFQRLYQLCSGYRAKKNHLNHKLDISQKEFVDWYSKQEKICYYCGFTLEEFLSIKSNFINTQISNTTRFGIDRKNNLISYKKENIVLCCVICNRLKGYFFNHNDFKNISEKYIKPKLIKYLNHDK